MDSAGASSLMVPPQAQRGCRIIFRNEIVGLFLATMGFLAGVGVPIAQQTLVEACGTN